INPDNPNILIDHLLLSLNELSFIEKENFGNFPWSHVKPILDQLTNQGIVNKNNRKYSINTSSPLSPQFSLRSINGNKLKLIDESQEENNVIGEIDYSSSFWMVHPNAIYLHHAEQYLVSKLDFEKSEVLLTKSSSNYYTEPKINKEYLVINEIESCSLNNLSLSFGLIKITQQVVGYKEILWESNQKIGEFEIELPETEMETDAFWFFIPDTIKNQLIEDNLWLNYENDYGPLWDRYKNLIRQRDDFTCQNCGIQEGKIAHHIHHIKPIKLFDSIEVANHPSNLTTLCPKCHRMAETQVRVKSGLAGLAYLLKTLAPIFVMCSPNDIDVIIDSKNNITGNENSILIYDNIPYGMGLSHNIFSNFVFIIEEIFEHAKTCGCSDGCPSCVGPVSEEGYGGKEEAIRLIELILRNIHES
ncbi:MAG TPA: Zn-binding domain-containing protein, partial [Anaerolineaceae bacterium]|nr:Zn-binding domain-containing protein [Anaerolineaceae bacterium]